MDGWMMTVAGSQHVHILPNVVHVIVAYRNFMLLVNRSRSTSRSYNTHIMLYMYIEIQSLLSVCCGVITKVHVTCRSLDPCRSRSIESTHTPSHIASLLHVR